MGRKPIPRKIARVRLDPTAYDALGAANPRGAAAEISRILEEYQRGELGDAMALLSGMIAGRADFALILYSDAKTDDERRAEFLGLVKDTLAFVLSGLGGKSVPYEENGVPIASGIAFDLIGQIRNPKPQDQSAEGRALARISKALGFTTATAPDTRRKPKRSKGSE